ncbi:MAG: TlyA family RNA methyltransferase [Pseudomonadota bacterium]|nr:TlyA family RNA methyltransferase [Pseudomonadota bacterium]
MRADQLIVARGLAPTRSAAQRLIDHRGVRWLAASGWAVPRKAGEDLPDDCSLEVTDGAELRFVSRGGLKLDAALGRTGIDAAGCIGLDIGQSTGGFTDVLLQRGAARVVGIDVGHGQLNPRLAADSRVTALEGVNVRNVAADQFAQWAPDGGFDIVVADLSFISLTFALPTIAHHLRPRGHALLLVKPQFELQPKDIGKNGLVKDNAAYPLVEARIRTASAAATLVVCDYFPSAISGGDGNREFFAWVRHSASATQPSLGVEAR